MNRRRFLKIASSGIALSLWLEQVVFAATLVAEQWAVCEASFSSARKYDHPFLDVQVDVVFRSGDQQWRVPAFWAGGDKWTVRFAPPVQGDYTFRVECSDSANQMVNGASQTLHVTAYTGDNPLLKHGAHSSRPGPVVPAASGCLQQGRHQ